MRLLSVAFLLLLGSDTHGRAVISVHKPHRSQAGIAAQGHSALLETTPVRTRVDTAPPLLLAAEARLPDRRVEFAPAPTRDSSPSLCSHERTSDQGARPPPFQT